MPISEEELNRLAEVLVQSQNARGIPEFEGYSPLEMNEIIYHPLDDSCPVRLNKLPSSGYQEIPILNIIKYILSTILERKKIKLTITGKLPVKLVAEIYAQGFYKDELINDGLRKLYSEESAMSIELSHILMQISGLVRKANGFLFVTKQGEKLLNNSHLLLKKLLVSLGQKFNMSYYDGYGGQPIGSIGWCYTLILLNKYGLEWAPAQLYAGKYFIAFPFLANATLHGDAGNCYIIRSFDRFLHLFGIIEIQKTHWFSHDEQIKASSLFHQLIHVDPPKNYQNPLSN